jgi:hypothetical protein
MSTRWIAASLPGCLGYPCLVAVVGDREVYVFRESSYTHETPCWRYRIGREYASTSVRGNLGTAKVAAVAAARRRDAR